MSAGRPALVSLIAAMAKGNRAIGIGGQLPWPKLPGEQAFFKSTTLGKPIIMGRKTYESIGRRLPGRLNIVVSRNVGYPVADAEIKVVTSLAEALRLSQDAEEAFIIGGGELYQQAMESSAITPDRLWITEVDGSFAGDAFFPRIDPTAWNEVSRVHNGVDGERNIAFDFVEYRRVA